MRANKRILFVKLGHFSFTNDHVTDQLKRNFPDHELMIVDVKDYAKRDPFASAFNIMSEAPISSEHRSSSAA